MLEPLTDDFIHFQLIQKWYPQERYSRFFPALGQGWSRFICDNPPEVSVVSPSRGFWFDTERPANAITQTSAKVAISSRFLGLVEPLPLEEQQLWLPNQQAHDPDSWITPHLFQLKLEYEVLINISTDAKCRKCTRCKTILLHLLSFS